MTVASIYSLSSTFYKFNRHHQKNCNVLKIVREYPEINSGFNQISNRFYDDRINKKFAKIFNNKKVKQNLKLFCLVKVCYGKT
jgi:hypothetical protein